eukprot:TRINITY_DN2116_c0_g5_i4.p1 TRINITY_DN2116_c0_g5~~TRINITY_DN2116_c0_g5_i4.p1  ORF type:complete len:316 (+),score=95.89 TRINITY_DN2116_c0_g5_i4:107-1054(+)
MGMEIEELKEGLEEILPELNELIEFHESGLNSLKSLAATLTYNSHRFQGEKYQDNIKKGLEADRKNLEKVVDAKNVESTLKVVQKIDEAVKLYNKKIPVSTLLSEFKKDLERFRTADMLKDVATITGTIAAKYRLLKATKYNKDWRCDRRYLSSKMTLSEDGLVYGNSASSGYPAIIGNLPFEDGLYAFEVIPEGLDCTAKEGFGIIEKEVYETAFSANPVTPAVFTQMLGFLFRRQAQNMRAETIQDMVLGAKYYVKVNMVELALEIVGPGVLLTAKLKPDTAYVPCFSCGCSNNKFRIRPLDDYDEPHTYENH